MFPSYFLRADVSLLGVLKIRACALTGPCPTRKVENGKWKMESGKWKVEN